jgi:hypothetical protein
LDKFDRREKQVVDVVAPMIEPVDTIRATVPVAKTGVDPLAPAFIGLLAAPLIRTIAVAVTDHHVYVLRRGWFTGRVKSPGRSWSRSEVSLEEWEPTNDAWSRLALRVGDRRLRMRVHRHHSGDARGVVNELLHPAAHKDV